MIAMYKKKHTVQRGESGKKNPAEFQNVSR